MGDIVSGTAQLVNGNGQAAAAHNANQLQADMFNQIAKWGSEFRQSGKGGVEALTNALGVGPNGKLNMNSLLMAPFTAKQYQESPGYKFQLGQGINAVQNSAAASGGVNSGNTMEALTKYGQGLANQDYQQGYNNYTGRQNNIYNMLQGLTNTGLQSNAMTATAGQNAVTQMGQNTMNGAAATAASNTAAFNSFGSLFNNMIYGAGQGAAGAGF